MDIQQNNKIQELKNGKSNRMEMNINGAKEENLFFSNAGGEDREFCEHLRHHDIKYISH